MTTSLASERSTRQHVPTGAGRLDLRQLDYYQRRRRLATELRNLAPSTSLSVVLDDGELEALRYEMDATWPTRFCWSLPTRRAGEATTVVRRSPAGTVRRRLPRG